MSKAERRSGSEQLLQRLLELDCWKQAGTVLMYACLPDELDLHPLIETGLQQGKIMTLPRFDPVSHTYLTATVLNPHADLQHGKYGIREPAAHCEPLPLNQLDLVLVPGVAFDMRGHRLGRGKGFYDRMLDQVSGIKCGIAFETQIINAVPVAAHDIPMDLLLTPTRHIFCTAGDAPEAHPHT